MTLSKFDIAVNEASSDRNSRVSNIRREEAGEVAFLLDAPGLGPLRMRLICRGKTLLVVAGGDVPLDNVNNAHF